MKKLPIKICAFLVVIVLSFQTQAFTLKGISNCDSGAYSYNFNNSINPNIQIAFTSFALSPDVTFKEVSSTSNADIIFDDNASNPDMKVCKSNKGKNIKIYKLGGEIALMPDYYVSISSISPNYTIYHNSSVFSIEEVIALIIATWAD
tara:strand:+ start:35 stop:478 length:444 start_codon:yes stop_codon:yes gene_type:complete